MFTSHCLVSASNSGDSTASILTANRSGWVDGCWPFPAHSVLVSGPVGIHAHIFVYSSLLHILKWGLFYERSGLTAAGALTTRVSQPNTDCDYILGMDRIGYTTLNISYIIVYISVPVGVCLLRSYLAMDITRSPQLFQPSGIMSRYLVLIIYTKYLLLFVTLNNTRCHTAWSIVNSRLSSIQIIEILM